MNKRKILVVDDDPQVYRIVSRLLDADCYEVFTASQGKEALEKIPDLKPDMLLLDLMMPEMSGVEVCEKIKKNPSTKDIVVFILSAKDGQVDRRRCFEVGADDYISKPFHIASLARKIEFTFEKGQASPEGPL